MPTTFTELAGAGSFILSEAAGQRSRENVTLTSGQVVKAGQVLAKIATKYVAYDEDNGVSGSNAASAISINAVDASDGDTKISVIANDAEVNGYQLAFSVGSPEASDPDAAAADLLANSRIKVRWGSIDHTENLS